MERIHNTKLYSSDGPEVIFSEHGSRTASIAVSSSSNDLLRSLPPDLFQQLKPSLRSVFLEAEQFLYFQDDRLEYVYFPETAVISELQTLDDGRMVEVMLTGREGAVGLMSLLCRTRAPHCTQVAQAGSAVRIESAALARIVRVHAEAARVLTPHLDQYVRQISQRSICNMYHSVKERLCTWLLLVQDRCGKKTLKLTHEQIARILGVYRPSVTCIALELRKNKMITYSRGGLSITDRAKVEDSACGCYPQLAGVH